jgi:hypothetical protein
MGDIAPDKRPKRVARKDNTDIAMYAEGGKAQGKQFVKQPPKVAAKTARYR